MQYISQFHRHLQMELSIQKSNTNLTAKKHHINLCTLLIYRLFIGYHI